MRKYYLLFLLLLIQTYRTIDYRLTIVKFEYCNCYCPFNKN